VLTGLTIRLILLFSAILTGACFTQSGLPNRVTALSIRHIQLGMSMGQVEEILGQPLAVQIGIYGSDPKSESLVYFRRFPIPIRYPMLWVHFRNGRVVEVYAKLHNVADSDGVYGLTSEHRWESPRFVATFPVER
jgi:hypothetical protein